MNHDLTDEQREAIYERIRLHLEKINGKKQTDEYLAMLENMKYGDR